MMFEKVVLLIMLMALSKDHLCDAEEQRYEENNDDSGNSDRISELEKIVHRQQEQIQKQQQDIVKLRWDMEVFQNAQARGLSYLEDELEEMNEALDALQNPDTQQDVDTVERDMTEIKSIAELCNKNMKNLETEVSEALGDLKTTIAVTSTLQAHVMRFDDVLENRTVETEIFKESLQETQETLKNFGGEIEIIRDLLGGVELKIEENQNAVGDQNQTLYKALHDENNKYEHLNRKLDEVNTTLSEKLDISMHSQPKEQKSAESVWNDTNTRVTELEESFHVQNLGIEALASSLLNQVAHLNTSMDTVNVVLYEHRHQVSVMDDKIKVLEESELQEDVEDIYREMNSQNERLIKVSESIDQMKNISDNGDVEIFESRIEKVEHLVDTLLQENAENALSQQSDIRFSKYDENMSRMEKSLVLLNNQVDNHTESLLLLKSQLESNMCCADLTELSMQVTEHTENASLRWSGLQQAEEKLRTLEISVQDLADLKTQVQQQTQILTELQSEHRTAAPTTAFPAPRYLPGFDFEIFNNDPTRHIIRNNRRNLSRRPQSTRNPFATG